MKAPHRRHDDETLDLFEWVRPANDTVPAVSTFQRVAGGWVEMLASGRVFYWSQAEGADTMEPSSICDDQRQLFRQPRLFVDLARNCSSRVVE